MPTVNLPSEQYRYLGKFAHRDESWATAFERMRAHVDEDAALEDKEERRTTYESDKPAHDDEPLRDVPDGTEVRHQYKRGNHRGTEVTAVIQNGHVVYEGEGYAPSPAARAADIDVRGDDGDWAHNGWNWWEFYDESRDEYRPLDELRS